MPDKANVTAIIIDDTELMRFTLRSALEHVGAEVIAEADNGRDGVDKAIELEPDLIILDVLMPKMNGYLALEEIVVRMHEPFVVMMTSVDDKEVIDQTRLVGAQDYIQKDLPINEVMVKLKRHVEFLASRKKNRR